MIPSVSELGLELPSCPSFQDWGAFVPCLLAVRGCRPGHQHQLLPGEEERLGRGHSSVGCPRGHMRLLVFWGGSVFGSLSVSALAAANSPPSTYLTPTHPWAQPGSYLLLEAFPAYSLPPLSSAPLSRVHPALPGPPHFLINTHRPVLLQPPPPPPLAGGGGAAPGM